ncbi:MULTISPECIES: murein biosynthesis integral membrane protein MurJ [unclassified Adlercreutzia]|uniref:murein biosynthesis integral membrane protein MurJ n=1 Tax=unclassified Adlercreutzia TaxID=2636013 RepID=UPI0013E9BE1B|nr:MULTISPECIES: murein biosynthesis integral membrane protein MurJ [unclassified Adlercreutzia]
MSEKLSRAQHTRGRHARIEDAPAPSPTRDRTPAEAPRTRGRHAGVDRDPMRSTPAGQTGLIPVIGSHAGVDRTQELCAQDEPEPTRAAQPRPKPVRHRAAQAEAAAEPPSDRDLEPAAPEVGTSAALISVCTIISRITGFARTWAMAFALGATFVSSSYQVANNLPNMLYELVMGGMLATAFLPVYLSVKKKLGRGPSEEYASNLLTIVVVGLGAVSLLCMLFPAQVIYTQTFYSNQDEMDLSVFLFRFFAIQVVFYGASSIVSGLLNANRDYLWGAIAPVFNNVIVIATFIMYAFVAPENPKLAFYVIAIGNPLGVFVQMAIQIPALKKNGIRLRPRINLRDPALRETVSLGVPALFVTICSFVTVSVTNAASYCFADNGPSVIAYSRLWFTFPYSFLAIPVATTMFTELSDMQADGNTRGVVRGITSGSSQIFFLMIPFALYLVVFSVPLVTLYHMGAFTSDSITQIAAYLAVMAAALPFYGVNTYLQMVFSSIRKMTAFSVVTFVASALQVGVVMASAWGVESGLPLSIECIAGGTIVAYLVGDVLLFAYLRRLYGAMGLGSIALSCVRALGLGLMGAAAGAGVLALLEGFVAPLDGSIAQAFAYIAVAGLISLVVTFGPAVKLQLPEAQFVTSITGKVARKLRRS